MEAPLYVCVGGTDDETTDLITSFLFPSPVSTVLLLFLGRRRLRSSSHAQFRILSFSFLPFNVAFLRGFLPEWFFCCPSDGSRAARSENGAESGMVLVCAECGMMKRSSAHGIKNCARWKRRKEGRQSRSGNRRGRQIHFRFRKFRRTNRARERAVKL